MLKAIIFDFDGVLADTEPLHFKMFQRVLHEEGLPLSEQDYYRKYVGLDDKGCFQAVLSSHGRLASPETVRHLVERKARSGRVPARLAGPEPTGGGPGVGLPRH